MREKRIKGEDRTTRRLCLAVFPSPSNIPLLCLILASLYPAGSLCLAVALTFPVFPHDAESLWSSFIRIPSFLPLSLFDSAVSSRIPNRLSKGCLKAKVPLLCPERGKETEMRRQTKGESDALREFPGIAQQPSVRNICQGWRLAKSRAKNKYIYIYIYIGLCAYCMTHVYNSVCDCGTKSLI